MINSSASPFKNDCFESLDQSHLIEDAEKGDLHAIYELASLVLEGAISDECLSEAYSWFEKVNNQGHLKSGLQMARMLILGEGVKQDVKEGTKRLQQFIKMDLPEAHYYYAYFSFLGIFPREIKTIQKHLKQAIQLGSEAAVMLSEELNKRLESDDYLEEKRFQKFKQSMRQYPSIQDSFFQVITSAKSAQLIEEHIEAALKGNLNSIEIIYDIYPADHEAKQFWFNHYLGNSQDSLALKLNFKSDSQNVSLNRRPHALNLTSSLYPKIKLRFPFPESIPLFLSSHLQDQFELIDRVKKSLKQNLTDSSYIVLHASIAKALVRKMLYDVSNIYDLANQPVREHPVGLLNIIFKTVIQVFYTNLGDFRSYTADLRYFHMVISKGNTFDLVPSLLKSVKSFDEFQKDAIYYVEDSIDLPSIYQTDEETEQFLLKSIDEWLSADNLKVHGQGFLLAWVALHTIIFQVSWDETTPLPLKAKLYHQFYASIETLVERFYGTFNLEALPETLHQFWLNDLIGNFMYQNVLEHLFESYDDRFGTYSDDETYTIDEDDWDDDWDDEDDEESLEELPHDSKRYIGSK